ncbi:MAG: HlyD family efflux transporter periplasmic adaptor subunit [Candidatus Eremiobacteraeota bacterium]|nr:HlyD family efflux transporter periplasmic adaptor subunit [Candidatus Eremiobacteraeota bacterium]
MDVRRIPAPGARRYLTYALGSAAVVAAIAAAAVLLRPSASGLLVDRSTIVTDTAARGTLTISVAAAGVLSAENVRIVDAVEPGVVASVAVKPGARVAAGDVIASMQSPDAQAALVEAASAVQVAQAQLRSAQAQLQASALAKRSALATAQAQKDVDATNFNTLEQLHRSGYVADATYQIARIKSGESAREAAISRSQIDVDAADQDARVAAAQAQVDNARAVLAAKLEESGALTVRASAPGVVQNVAVDPGVRLDAGAQIATIADTRSLKAVVQVPETQVHDIFVGMACNVDTGNGTVTGRIERIAPTANNGSVAVDVALGRDLPAVARPSLNVNATIVVARIADALSILRPAGAADGSTVGLYRIAPGGRRATLTQVRLGRGSVDRVAVLAGLRAGDSVIVSDASAYANQPSLTLR